MYTREAWDRVCWELAWDRPPQSEKKENKKEMSKTRNVWIRQKTPKIKMTKSTFRFLLLLTT